MKKMYVLIMLAGILLSVASCRSESVSEMSTPISTAIKPQDEANSVYAYTYPGITPAVAMLPTNSNLIYVSRDYALPTNYVPLLQVCISTYPQKIELEVSAATQYRIMYDAALVDGVEIIPYSGYRSVSHQKSIFDEKTVHISARVITVPRPSI